MLAAIEIPFPPNIITLGPVPITWHGVFSVIAVIAAVLISVREARRLKVNTDAVYNIAPFAIIGGLIGARLTHVFDNWDTFSQGSLLSIVNVFGGGMGLWGGILGGWLAGLAYAYLAKYPVERIGRIMDAAAPAMLVAQTIGRIGDVINGEHCARETSLPWGWFFTHPQSPGRSCIINSNAYSQGYFPLGTSPTTPVHPAVVYEMIWNILGLGLLYLLRDRLKPSGSIWFVYLAWYAVGRFAIQSLRLDPVYLFNFLQEAHIIAILVLLGAIPVLLLKTRFRDKKLVKPPQASA